MSSRSYRKGERGFLTHIGGVSLALKVTAGCVASCKLGRVLEMDLHHATVNRWELRTEASLLLASKLFYLEHEITF
eukprot:5236985-Pyramimonas_sp.AAC.1